MQLLKTSISSLWAPRITRAAGIGQPIRHEASAWRVFDDKLFFNLGEHSYLGHRRLKLSTDPQWSQEILLTIVPANPGCLPLSEWCRSLLDDSLQPHDILQLGFLENVYYEGIHRLDDNERKEIAGLLASYHPSSRLIDLDLSQGQSPRSGAYAITGGVLWQISKLHDDVQGAFMVPLEPDHGQSAKSSFRPLIVFGRKYQTLRVALPAKPLTKPVGSLVGLNFATKDMFNVKGITTTLCNRAFYETSAPADSTAMVICQLLDAGADLIGTTKLSSMLSREEPSEAVDYQQPFNPRADGYQSPAGSSSGSAAAIAAYEWLDFSVAEDTSGSGRRPAAANGCFQFKPTHDLAYLDGMKTTMELFDTPVIHTRDYEKIELIAPFWRRLSPLYSNVDSQRSTRWDTIKIIYPQDFLPESQARHLEILEEFISDLEATTESKAIRPRLTDLWQDHPPADAKSGQNGMIPVEDYLKNVVVQTYYRDFYHSQAQFRDAYFQKFAKQPFVNPFVHWRWNLGKVVTDVEYQRGLHRLKTYKSWILETVIKGAHQFNGNHGQDRNPDGLFPISVLILPISEGWPKYRDSPPPEPQIQSGFDPLYLSPILGGPDLVLPIGEVPYHSRISDREEMLPICVSLVGVPGQDEQLLRIVKDTLVRSGRPLTVKTGARMFGPADESPDQAKL